MWPTALRNVSLADFGVAVMSPRWEVWAHELLLHSICSIFRTGVCSLLWRKITRQGRREEERIIACSSVQLSGWIGRVSWEGIKWFGTLSGSIGNVHGEFWTGNIMGFRWTRWQEHNSFCGNNSTGMEWASNADFLMLLNPCWLTPTSQGVCQSLPTHHLRGLV